LIVRWKGRVPAGRVNETSVITAVDFFPTITRLAGVKMNSATDGETMQNAWLGKAQQRKRPFL
jgi:N-acetylgalactosamine-6-sulfatase